MSCTGCDVARHEGKARVCGPSPPVHYTVRQKGQWLVGIVPDTHLRNQFVGNQKGGHKMAKKLRTYQSGMKNIMCIFHKEKERKEKCSNLSWGKGQCRPNHHCPRATARDGTEHRDPLKQWRMLQHPQPPNGRTAETMANEATSPTPELQTASLTLLLSRSENDRN